MTAARQVAELGDAAGTPPPRRFQHVSGWHFAPGAAMLGGPAGLRADGAPWWIWCVLAVLGAGTAWLYILIPQNSRDKLAWWRERRRSRQQCPCQEGDDGTVRCSRP